MNSLCEDVLSLIFKNLDTDTLLSARAVCKKWKNMIQTETSPTIYIDSKYKFHKTRSIFPSSNIKLIEQTNESSMGTNGYAFEVDIEYVIRDFSNDGNVIYNYDYVNTYQSNKIPKIETIYIVNDDTFSDFGLRDERSSLIWVNDQNKVIFEINEVYNKYTELIFNLDDFYCTLSAKPSIMKPLSL